MVLSCWAPNLRFFVVGLHSSSISGEHYLHLVRKKRHRGAFLANGRLDAYHLRRFNWFYGLTRAIYQASARKRKSGRRGKQSPSEFIVLRADWSAQRSADQIFANNTTRASNKVANPQRIIIGGLSHIREQKRHSQTDAMNDERRAGGKTRTPTSERKFETRLGLAPDGSLGWWGNSLCTREWLLLMTSL